MSLAGTEGAKRAEADRHHVSLPLTSQPVRVVGQEEVNTAIYPICPRGPTHTHSHPPSLPTTIPSLEGLPTVEK